MILFYSLYQCLAAKVYSTPSKRATVPYRYRAHPDIVVVTFIGSKSCCWPTTSTKNHNNYFELESKQLNSNHSIRSSLILEFCEAGA